MFSCGSSGRNYDENDTNDFIPILIKEPDNSTRFIELDDQCSYFMLNFFSTHCPDCQIKTEAILRNIDNFSGIDIYMLSADDMDMIIDFKTLYHLSDYDNIVIGQIEFEVAQKYNFSLIPAIYFFDVKGNLLYSSFGSASISGIIELINNHSQL